MKKTILQTSLTALLFLSLAAPVFAADKDKEVTVTGDGKCAKCALHETEKCQNVIQTQEDGKTVNYYLAENDLSKKFHKANLCEDSKKVTATGTVKEEGGKKVLTASKLDLAK